MAECMNADRQRARIIEDIDEAIELGLASTPAVWVNGRAVVHPSKATLIPIIDHLLTGGSTSQP
jgi:protein-disulfide isomerase